ncbi:type III-B CRISPR-associated protein Cas10/Cmr2 [Aphanizomenon sp. CS-733/32]|uniref:type III-B CRISPR-associated protein Cas10/Cmr2 n=1 Tax=Aphanizomenon sp. CS-733/32 TaxID=3021715 RepID=UPI00232C24CD|nr:type III-B CRISPR-associated protein Cas10/Cmr2 [Aphanizomenon sp. CS-733/32]MDB9310660.1 type III-B CRISPR-associated protein Cas10/Cmr2 [Aphanizomenon sp. CS-733/32]
MDKMNSVSIAIAWCLAWGNEHQPQFDISVLQQMREALKNGGEVPEAVKEIVDQVREFQSIPDDYFPQTLDDLKNKYPKLWNQTTKIGLVYGGVTKVKQYVFESSKIQEIRGASGLLDRINIIDLPAFFNKPTESNLYRFYDPTIREWLQLNFPNSNLLEALIPELIIYSCGGNILAFCPAAYVHNLADAIEKRYTTETLTANSCAVGDTFRLLEIRFGVLKENIEDTHWLNWYHKNYQNPIVQAYFGYPKDEKERLAVFQNRKSFNEITTKLAVLFNQRRSGNDIPGRKTTRRYPPMLETHPYLVRDGVENRSAILQIDKEGRKVNFSEASVRKYLFGNRAKDGDPNEPQWYINSQLEWPRGIVESWVDRFNEFLNENPTYQTKYYANLEAGVKPSDVKIAQTLTHVSNASKGFIGYIYADGNNMGGYIQKIRKPDKHKEFSRDVDLATRYAVYQALAENLHPHTLKNLNDEESELENGDIIHPFEIITIGGDDIFIVVPANKALEISQMIAERFEEILLNKIELAEIQIQGREKRILDNYQLKVDKLFEPHKIHRYQPSTAKRSECELSTSIGVLITAVNTPIYYAKDLTEQLLKTAKEQAKKLKKFGYYGGTVDFLTLKSVTMIASNVKDFRTEALSPQNLRLYAAPYTLHELGGLLTSVAALKTAKFPRSQLYQIRSLLEQGRHTAILNYRYFRVRLKQGQKELKANFEDVWCLPKDDTNKGNLAPWMYDKEEKIYETIWRDMVDIYEFVKSAEDEESAILTAEVES